MTLANVALIVPILPSNALTRAREFMLADFVENDGDGIANGHFANSEPMRDSSAPPR